MTKDVQEITKVLELLYTACDNIHENWQCKECPIQHLCLRGEWGEATLFDLAELVTVGTWTEFLEYADECIPSEELQEEMHYAQQAEYDPYDDL